MNTLKIYISLFILNFLFSSCSENNSNEPTNSSPIIGKWVINSMAWTSIDDSGMHDQTKLDSIGIIWELTLSSDNSARQITNLSGPTTTQSGSWTTTNNKLLLQLKGSDSEEFGTIEYIYSINNGSLQLDWTLIEIVTQFTALFQKE